MGIQDIATFIKKQEISYGKTIELRKYRHRIVCIDAGTFYSRMMANNKRLLSSKTAEQLMDPEFTLTSDDIVPGLISLVLPFITCFLSCNVVPLVVFDGTSPEEKSDTRAKRNAKTKEAQDIVDGIRVKYNKKKYVSADDLDVVRKKLGSIFYIKKEHFDSVKEVLKQSNLPYVQSNEEAERLCVSLVREGVCRSAYSMDSDMIAHLCPNWMQDVNSKLDVPTANIIKPEYIAKKLSLTKEQLTDFCIMCGCDYNTRVHMMGPAKSYNKIIQHGSIENVYTKEEMKPLKVAKCRAMFNYKKSTNMIVLQESNNVAIEGDTVTVAVNLKASRNDNVAKRLCDLIEGLNMSSLEKFDEARILCSKYWKKRAGSRGKEEKTE